MNNTTIQLFEKYAGKYDEFQSALVPSYDAIIAMVADAYGYYVGEGTFLDLGCGTGNVSQKILSESPKSRVFLHDGSSSMLEIAKGKIEKRAGGPAILGAKAANLEHEDWHQGIDGPFDAIVSAFVLEHLQEKDYKAVIWKCHELMRPGGAFISLEWSDNEYGMQDWFFESMKRKGESLPQYADVIEESKRMEHHYFVNFREKMSWLEDAGFQNVHTIWQYLFGYIIVGEK